MDRAEGNRTTTVEWYLTSDDTVEKLKYFVAEWMGLPIHQLHVWEFVWGCGGTEERGGCEGRGGCEKRRACEGRGVCEKRRGCEGRGVCEGSGGRRYHHQDYVLVKVSFNYNTPY